MRRVLLIVLLSLLIVPSVKAQTGHEREIDARVAELIQELYEHPWPGAAMIAVPMEWEYNFTPPMQKLLEIGSPAQRPLLAKLSDVAIVDQVIVLLGGVGDEESVGPIIEAIRKANSDQSVEHRRRIVTVGNLALTNITVADVIWHHGGGIVVDRCPRDPAGCWAAWWARNKATFRVGAITQSRRYSNYPNYGIYHGLP